MPVYEYRCHGCRGKSSVFARSMADPQGLSCSHCGGTDLQRAISGFAYHRSMSRVWEESGPPSMMGDDEYYKDPRNIGRRTEERLDQLGVEMPSEAREMMDAAREGDMPEPLKDL